MYHPGYAAAYLSKSPQNTAESLKVYDGSGDWFKINQTGFEVDKGTSSVKWYITGKQEVCEPVRLLRCV